MAEPCQVDFYVLTNAQASAGRLACKLSLMAWEQGHRVAVVAEDESAARALDELMWDYPQSRFLPHERNAGDSDVPVSIVLSADAAGSGRDVLINLAGDAVQDPSGLRRLLEIVPSEERLRAASREKFRHYRTLGLEPGHHEIATTA